MAEVRGIQTSLFLLLLLQFTAAATTRQGDLSLAVRDGDEVTLPCNSVIDDQNNCDRTTWFYSNSSSRLVELVTDGQIGEQAEDKSDRLSVTENCSLVIKKVTEEDDAGYYTCRRIRSRRQQYTLVPLFVVTMTEQKNSDEVTLTCSVSIYDRCLHTVKWLFEGQDVDKNNGDLKTSQSLCSASVTFRTSHYIHTSSYQSLSCNLTHDFTGTVALFPFRPPRPSGEETTTESPTTTSGNSTEAGWWWWLIIVFVVALLIIIVAVIRWKRAKGNQTQRDENMADPEGGVSYASVSYTKKTSSKAQVLVKGDDDEGDAVTYSTVKASSSSSASANPSDLYATVNKPNK